MEQWSLNSGFTAAYALTMWASGGKKLIPVPNDNTLT